ncbi:hypothetical protein A3709_07660 [Halioglobus sp. HI00S01]|uniref:flagellar transcriptional regulator FlhD n=1 Tax=Halioglobus sp. HI00S01 TaxID=1822214 RepID=UPI0007C37A0D|nr:flagellar transcriptional regulator FlhD [Halioglobus sp. HI00S01]KZX54892.1 hypothetical protein A3709_07660 [Halioglobus sp. HI00S01]
MINRDTLDEIQEMNMTYLLLAKQLLSDDRAAAIFRLGISEDVADYIQSLPSRKLVQIARSSQLICALRFSEVRELEVTLATRRDHIETPSHQAILLASKLANTVEQ